MLVNSCKDGINMTKIEYAFNLICNKFGANLSSKFRKLMQKQHLLMVLFWVNLVSNISTRASKRILFKARLALF